MQYTSILLSALAVLPAANCVTFGGPAPTAINPDRALDGFTPKPTKGPSAQELRKRQSDSNTCGWVDADYSSGITCSAGRTCVLYTASDLLYGMAGCCESGDTQNCGWASACVDDDSYSSSLCDSDCMSNTLIRKCTDSGARYCVTWAYMSDDIYDYGCTADSLDTFQLIYPDATDSNFDSTTLTLSTVSDDAISFADTSSFDITDLPSATDLFTDLFTTGTDSDSSDATDLPSVGGGGGRRKSKKGKKVSVGLIVGVVAGVLVLLGVIVAVIIFLCVKKKKQRQLAANQTAIANAQAMRPQSQAYPQNQPPQMQQMPPPMPPPMPTPGPEHAGYFAQHPTDQKINPQAQVHEYSVQTPASNPATPAPPYIQPYYAQSPVVPPMPAQSPAPYQTREPAPGHHEVDSISVAHPPQGQPGQAVHEIGGGK